MSITWIFSEALAYLQSERTTITMYSWIPVPHPLHNLMAQIIPASYLIRNNQISRFVFFHSELVFLKTFPFPGFLGSKKRKGKNKINQMTSWTTPGFLTPTLQQIIPPGGNNVWKWAFRHVTDGKLWHINQVSSATRGEVWKAHAAGIIACPLWLTQLPEPLVLALCQHLGFSNFLTVGTAPWS